MVGYDTILMNSLLDFPGQGRAQYSPARMCSYLCEVYFFPFCRLSVTSSIWKLELFQSDPDINYMCSGICVENI